jgi:transcriptional regulator with XRE-family HTH domain
MLYFVSMNNQRPLTDLTAMREQAGLTVRELARQLNTSHTNVINWEKAGHVTKTEYLIPMSEALGVTVDELLGRPRPSRTVTPGGKMGKVLEEASRLPRRQQQKIIDIVEPFIREQAAT